MWHRVGNHIDAYKAADGLTLGVLSETGLQVGSVERVQTVGARSGERAPWDDERYGRVVNNAEPLR